MSDNHLQGERTTENFQSNSDLIPTLRLLVKDHMPWGDDEAFRSRPVVNGTAGMNTQLSTLLSLILESVDDHMDGSSEIRSTSELFLQI